MKFGSLIVAIFFTVTAWFFWGNKTAFWGHATWAVVLYLGIAVRHFWVFIASLRPRADSVPYE